MKKDDYFTLITVLIGAASFYVSFKSSKLSSSDLVIIGIISGMFALYFVISSVYFSLKGKFSKIDKNSKEISRLSSEIAVEHRFNKLEKDIIIMKTKMNKKGSSNIDPRLVIIILMILFFLLLLKNLGYLP